MMGAAQTGTGKTAAFLLPLLNKLVCYDAGETRALILVPTRELALQIDEQVMGLGYHAEITSACVVGGMPMGPQEKALKHKVDILIATPGRLMDHMRFPYCDLSNIEYIVLDEADRMLDIGFLPDVRRILLRVPKERQSLLFSATISPDVQKLAKEFLTNPKHVKIGRQQPASAIAQSFYDVSPNEKTNLLIRLLDDEDMHSVIVFGKTKSGVRSLDRKLRREGFASECIHGGRTQTERVEALGKFRRGDVDILVATDIASRGLDITDVSHVVNYDIPEDPDDYIHRVGRTARAKKTGDAITFVTRHDGMTLKKIEKALKKKIKPEKYSRSKKRR